MKRIFLTLLAVGTLTAADVLTVDPAGTVIVAGTVPTGLLAGEVRMGGGRVATSLAFDSWFNGLMQGTWASDAIGPFIQWRQPGKNFSVYDEAGGQQFVVTKNPPTTVSAGRVVIGGGYIWAGANQFNMRPSADVPIEIVNRQATGGIDLYPDGFVKAVQITKTNTTFNVPVTSTGTVTAGDVVVNRATPAVGAQAVRGDDPRMTNARPAAGGDAATVGGKAPSAFVQSAEKGVANGVASLDASGKVPAAMLPLMAGAKGIQFFTVNGTFTVPSGVTQIQVILLGAGNGGTGTAHTSDVDGTYARYGAGGNAGGFAWVQINNPQSSYSVTIGQGGAAGSSINSSSGVPAGGAGSASSFGSAIVCNGGTNLDGGSVVLNGVTGLSVKGAKISQLDSFAQYSREAAGAYMFGSSGAGFGSGGHPGEIGRPGLCIVMW